jgi:ATP-dependent exoDNAse (exonuclease V) beta subunit
MASRETTRADTANTSQAQTTITTTRRKESGMSRAMLRRVNRLFNHQDAGTIGAWAEFQSALDKARKHFGLPEKEREPMPRGWRPVTDWQAVTEDARKKLGFVAPQEASPT